jgi:hypothetical protein
MELKELNPDERIALVALIGLVVQQDNRVSDSEARRVARDVAALGDEAYSEAAAEADRRFADQSDQRAFLAGITRQEARELIYATVLDAALADTPDRREAEILDWLAETWKVKTRIEDA